MTLPYFSQGFSEREVALSSACNVTVQSGPTIALQILGFGVIVA